MTTTTINSAISNTPFKGRGEAKIGSKITSELVTQYATIMAKRQSLSHALALDTDKRQDVIVKILSTMDAEAFDTLLTEIMNTTSFIQPHLASTFKDALTKIATDDHIVEMFSFMLDYDRDDSGLINEVATLTGMKRISRDETCRDYALRVFPKYIKGSTNSIKSAYKTVLALVLMMQEANLKEKRIFDVLSRVVAEADTRAWDSLAQYEEKWLTQADLREIELSEADNFEFND